MNCRPGLQHRNSHILADGRPGLACGMRVGVKNLIRTLTYCSALHRAMWDEWVAFANLIAYRQKKGMTELDTTARDKMISG